MNKLLVVFAIVVVSLSSSFARHGKKGGGDMKEIFKQLNLTQEQEAKIKNIRASNKGSMKGTKEKMKQLREQLKISFKSNASDETLKNLHSQIQALKMQKSSARFEQKLSIRAVLNSEQRAKFQELKESKKGKRRRHRKGGDDE